MNRKHHTGIARLILVITVMFILVAAISLYGGSKYIRSKLLTANENMAVDIALLVKNNFHITDDEVAYMKSLTFNEMEVDEINMRLMDVGNGVQLNTDVINVYIVSALKDDEIKYTTDEETAEFFGYDTGTKLDGVWLLNGIIGEDGNFLPKQRDDIYRYTQLTDTMREGMKNREAFGDYSSDAWGNFITGYAPVFTEEGNFVGLLGIDMDPDKYQASAMGMIFVLIIAFLVVSVVMVCLFLYFYFKYIKAKEGQLYFDFYSRMSHDMRTPMNGILGMAALSKDETDMNTLHHNFELVEESGKYMLGLINDTLDVQKLDAGKLKLDPKVRNCNTIIESLLSMIKNDAAKKNIEFKFVNKFDTLDNYVYVDELRIQQIFMNLASNAVKFTEKGGTITFTAECLSTEGDVNHDRFTISDTGIGMSREFISKHLFKPFEQEQNSVTTQYGGSGLGLSIVKNLVELMGGRIEVESEVGKGTSFTVYLDIQTADEQTVKDYLQTKGKSVTDNDILKDMKILLCEDHPLNALIATKLLEKYGCHIVTATNGREGVEIFSESKAGDFDLILMDIRMPVMDGLEATAKIRALHRKDSLSIPIIAMTANAYDEDIENCLNAGMNEHIAKPIIPEKMVETICSVVKNKNSKSQRTT